MVEAAGPAQSAAAVAIAERIDSYLEELAVKRDVEAAGDFYTIGTKVLGPDIDLDRAGVIDAIRSVLDAGVEVKFNRRTLELFVHEDAAYEIAQADDTFLNPDGTSNTMRNNLFIRWEKGSDGKWRFARVLLSPRKSTSS